MTDDRSEELSPLAAALELEPEEVLGLLREILAEGAANDDVRARVPLTDVEKEVL